jgi:hypothetical protein
MVDRRTANKGALSGWLMLLFGLLVGAAVSVAGWLLRQPLREMLPPPWDDFVELPVLVGQGAFAAVLVLLLLEWARLRGREAQVKGLVAEDQRSWAGAMRYAALTGSHPRPFQKARVQQLERMRNRLRWRTALRWLLYTLLAVAPAAGGLVVGLRSAQVNRGLGLRFTDLFLPVLVGAGQGVVVWLLGAWLRLRTQRMLDNWLARCLALEAPAPTVKVSEPPKTTEPPKRRGEAAAAPDISKPPVDAGLPEDGPSVSFD